MDPVVDLAVRAGFAFLFGAAAIHKAGDLPRFRATLADYRLLPAPALRVAAATVVAVELAVGMALLAPDARGLGLGAAAALLSAYAAAIAVNLVRGRVDLDCGCFAGTGRRTISWWLVLRNAVLVVAAVAALGPVEPRALAWIDALTVAGALATAALVWAATDGLLANLDGVARIKDSVRGAVRGAA